jgi:hypothetical protein
LGDAKDALRTAVDRDGHLGEDVLAEATALLCG